MSDFLSRLAERALGAAPPLQPLLGSRYAGPSPAEPSAGFVEETVEGEPSPSPAPAVRRAGGEGGGPLLPPSVVAVDAQAVDAAPPAGLVPTPPATRPAEPVSVPAAAATSSPRPRSSASPTPSAGDAVPSAPAPRPESPAPSPDAGSRITAMGEIRDDRGSGDEALLIPVSTRSGPPVPAPSARAQGEGDAPPSAVDGGRAVAAAAPSAPESGVRPAARKGGRGREEDDGEALLMPPAPGRSAAAPVPISGDGGEGEDGRAGPRHPWAPERVPAARVEKGGGERPVVQVTIGRLEVRAVHPPAAPQPAREAGWTPPVLSLDEYLKRGSGR